MSMWEKPKYDLPKYLNYSPFYLYHFKVFVMNWNTLTGRSPYALLLFPPVVFKKSSLHIHCNPGSTRQQKLMAFWFVPEWKEIVNGDDFFIFISTSQQVVYWDSRISSAISKNKINKINQTIFLRHLHPTRSKGDV